VTGAAIRVRRVSIIDRADPRGRTFADAGRVWRRNGLNGRIDGVRAKEEEAVWAGHCLHHRAIAARQLERGLGNRLAAREAGVEVAANVGGIGVTVAAGLIVGDAESAFHVDVRATSRWRHAVLPARRAASSSQAWTRHVDPHGWLGMATGGQAIRAGMGGQVAVRIWTLAGAHLVRRGDLRRGTEVEEAVFGGSGRQRTAIRVRDGDRSAGNPRIALSASIYPAAHIAHVAVRLIAGHIVVVAHRVQKCTQRLRGAGNGRSGTASSPSVHARPRPAKGSTRTSATVRPNLGGEGVSEVVRAATCGR